MLDQLDPKYELFFTITKFENDIGFSLIHQEGEGDYDLDPDMEPIMDHASDSLEKRHENRIDRARQERKALLTRHGVIPEYIKISEIYQVYTAFT